MSKVFLGGTCAETKWRDKVIDGLNIDYFNPVVDDWTPDCIAEEYRQKNKLCDIHLYVITPQMKGIFSIAEVIQSCFTPGKKVVLCVMNSDEIDDSSWTKEMKKSLDEFQNLAKKDGAIICHSLNEVIKTLNSYGK